MLLVLTLYSSETLSAIASVIDVLVQVVEVQMHRCVTRPFTMTICF